MIYVIDTNPLIDQQPFPHKSKRTCIPHNLKRANNTIKNASQIQTNFFLDSTPSTSRQGCAVWLPTLTTTTFKTTLDGSNACEAF